MKPISEMSDDELQAEVTRLRSIDAGPPSGCPVCLRPIPRPEEGIVWRHFALLEKHAVWRARYELIGGTALLALWWLGMQAYEHTSLTRVAVFVVAVAVSALVASRSVETHDKNHAVGLEETLRELARIRAAIGTGGSSQSSN